MCCKSFVVRHSADGAQVHLIVRIDGQAIGLRVRTSRGSTDLTLAEAHGGAWRDASTIIDAPAVGEVMTLEAVGGAYRDYHVWITR